MGGACGKSQKPGDNRNRNASVSSGGAEDSHVSRKSGSTVDAPGSGHSSDDDLQHTDGENKKFNNLKKIDKVSSLSSIKRDLRKKETLINRIIGDGGEGKRYHGKPRLSLMYVPEDVNKEENEQERLGHAEAAARKGKRQRTVA
mmetsp:Transcript_43998/g.50637  ORF Transcript_43998/g.50637 Transcript_43998/m.50637 type:complete len:144 (-) Transcript_43998:799-1230(-)|eukprot:CAMPEP_0115001636 /NCGR_PEP_ID=MMETSP0216-20121206/17503_1 /TAXON_ID=223996 /ORGANISM="Protocruzia adherens, Strain Boccale" /LENGTH=143 /DNA_ID=CAMNT_0002367027 /DNA_START=237 /DNA_END=668 /DNA_ORIENTATION=+